MVEFIDKTTEQSGTPINRETLMGVQGFLDNNVTITRDSNGGYTITTIMPKSGHKLTATLVEKPDGSMTVTEVFEGEKIMTKTTTINAEMNSIEEVIG